MNISINKNPKLTLAEIQIGEPFRLEGAPESLSGTVFVIAFRENGLKQTSGGEITVVALGGDPRNMQAGKLLTLYGTTSVKRLDQVGTLQFRDR